MKMSDKKLAALFRLTFAEARKGVRLRHGGPFGAAVIDRKGKVVATAHNTVLRDNDPSCHAEVNAIRAAAKKLKHPHLEGCVVIASSEPCPMCLTTSYWANVAGIVYAVPKEVAAGVGFDDSFIYEELDRPPSRRRIAVEHFEPLLSEGASVFKEWQAANGKLY